jgi:hypothetical protein
VEPDQEQVAELTALVRKTHQILDILDQKRADALTELLRLLVGQALDAGANWNLIEGISGLDLSEFVVARYREV